jgi:Flp pilus assembly protein TadG
MSGRSVTSLGEERGQSLVLVVFSLFGLVMVLALVVDVGMWLRADRHAQSVADAAALAGAQELPDSRAARDAALAYAAWNWPDADVSSSRDASSIEVVVRSNVPGLFSRLVGILDVNVRADARAEINAPTSVRGVTPLAVRCTTDSDSCTSFEPSLSFQYQRRSTDIDNITIAPIELSRSMDEDDFAPYLDCDARAPGAGCYPGEFEPDWYDVLGLDADDFCEALTDGSSIPRLVAVFDSARTSLRELRDVRVVGWAVFTFEVRTCSRGTVSLDGTLGRFLVAGTGVSSDTDDRTPDFGVRAVALTE